jgi:hypothetical protein
LPHGLVVKGVGGWIRRRKRPWPAVITLWPLMISLMREAGTSMALARRT